eukprot:CAMPEP_0181313840 /NCGR_PEP_ID=MMETSP1101-20121128/14477_1 /TAXON_ID=46948 /ORGANISM="Rhodomonas abbreviata, Strain Caron Lab Isolate" /LENGTH=155 /DNA_ID=CAMNT_0023420849 /DNA_START=221 /DNA_END=685 /DNA_ORIENTATION=+
MTLCQRNQEGGSGAGRKESPQRGERRSRSLLLLFAVAAVGGRRSAALRTDWRGCRIIHHPRRVKRGSPRAGGRGVWWEGRGEAVAQMQAHWTGRGGRDEEDGTGTETRGDGDAQHGTQSSLVASLCKRFPSFLLLSSPPPSRDVTTPLPLSQPPS